MDLNSIVGSERIYLKKISIKEVNDRYASWFQNEELMRLYTSSKKAISKDDIINSILQGEQTETLYTYGIYYKENNLLIGQIRLGPINKAHKISDLVILVGDTKYLGMGIATEAIKLGNRIAFEKHNIRKLFGGIYETNIASIKAYTRANWVIEGRLKNHYIQNEQSIDRILVACFNPEYF